MFLIFHCVQNIFFCFIEPPKSNKEIISNSIIETKPIDNKKVIEIKPSKTVILNDKKPSENKKSSTLVQIKTQAAPVITRKVEVKSAPITKVNVVEGKSSSAIAHPPLIVSKVQVSYNKIIILFFIFI